MADASLLLPRQHAYLIRTLRQVLVTIGREWINLSNT